MVVCVVVPSIVGYLECYIDSATFCYSGIASRLKAWVFLSKIALA